MTASIKQLAVAVGKKLHQREWKLATAESCTGGGVAYAITDIAGSSDWFDRGFVTYSNAAKQEMLRVKTDTLAAMGAVSEKTVFEMAMSALAHSQAQVAVAISGIAGPTGGSVEKPVGTVWFACASIEKEVKTLHVVLTGDRQAIREQAIEIALQQLLEFI